jgi:hypothetical protein
LKKRNILVGQLLGPPLIVVFRKKLNAVTLKPMRDLDRLVVTAGNGLMGSEDWHERMIEGMPS